MSNFQMEKKIDKIIISKGRKWDCTLQHAATLCHTIDQIYGSTSNLISITANLSQMLLLQNLLKKAEQKSSSKSKNASFNKQKNPDVMSESLE